MLNRILVVDDDPMWREAVSRAVADCGYMAVTADGVAEAMAWLQQQEFVLVITDNYMPYANEGVELLQYMDRAMKKPVPTILQSSTYPSNLKLILETFPWVSFLKKQDRGDLEWLMRHLKGRMN